MLTPFNANSSRGYVWCSDGSFVTVPIMHSTTKKRAPITYMEKTPFTKGVDGHSENKSIVYFCFYPGFGSRYGTEFPGWIGKYRDIEVPYLETGEPGSFGIGVWNRYISNDYKTGKDPRRKFAGSSMYQVVRILMPTPQWMGGIDFPRTNGPYPGYINCSIPDPITQPDADQRFAEFMKQLNEKLYKCMKVKYESLIRIIGNKNQTGGVEP